VAALAETLVPKAIKTRRSDRLNNLLEAELA